MSFNAWNNISYKQKIITFTVSYGLLIFIVSYFLLMPTIDNIKNLKKDIINQKIELEKSKNRDQNMAKLSTDIKKIEPEINYLNQVFTDKNNKLEFITMFEGLANKNNVTQNLDMDKGEPIKASLFQKNPITVTVNGSYSDLVAYLKDVETLKQYINIRNLNLAIDTANRENYSVSSGSNLSSNKKGQLFFNADSFWK